MAKYTKPEWKVADAVANFDRVHRTPEEITEHKKLLKKFKRHIKNGK